MAAEAATAAVAIILVEFGLRNVGGVSHDTFMMPDHYRGWVLKPGFSGWISDENTLWVLGDSYMQGINVPREGDVSVARAGSPKP